MHVTAPADDSASRTSSLRPMRHLLERLPHLPLDATGNIDFACAAPMLLLALAEDAEATMSSIHQGLGAVGHLLAHSAVPIEDGTIGADSLESLGFLMAELGDLAAACMTLAAHCRRAAGSAEQVVGMSSSIGRAPPEATTL